MDIKVHLKSKSGMFSMYRFTDSHIFIKNMKTGDIKAHNRKDFHKFAGKQEVPFWLMKMFEDNHIHPTQKKFNYLLRVRDIDGIETLLNSL